MTTTVVHFQELSPELQALAGGKGARLARMFQQGYPVPQGFIILPAAFEKERLSGAAWEQVSAALGTLRKDDASTCFAVRSSALAEDSRKASFAGAFETLLNVQTDSAIREAVETVYQSKNSARVETYGEAQGIPTSNQMAVVIQRMVPAELSGVLFTADPLTGSYQHMTGNFVHGLGDQLVSGEANASEFRLARPKGAYAGPPALKKFAARLYGCALRLEQDGQGPQDIEWAVADGRLYLLQARPVTTLTQGSLDTYDLNFTLADDAVWTNTNVAEAIPDVFSPLTWSIGRHLDEELNFIPGYYVWSGNICGRAYMNISRRVSVIAAVLGKDARSALKLLGDLYGELPEGMEMPLHPFSRWELLKVMIPRVMHVGKNTRAAMKALPRFLEDTPAWCGGMAERIAEAATGEALLNLWKQSIQPYTFKAWWSAAAGGSALVSIMTLDKQLRKLAGQEDAHQEDAHQEDANTLLSNLRSGGEMASLGPVMGVSKILRGEMSREEYLRRYGHRGPHEYELSIPHPAEDASWLDRQIEDMKKSPMDAAGLLQKQQSEYEAALRRFKERYPNKARWLEKQIARAAQGARLREAARSEFVRVFRLIRTFALRAGALAGIGDDIFFLYIHEVEELLSGNRAALRHIPARKANVAKFKALPPFPSIIRGRFHPQEWLKEPQRRLDYYDASQPLVLEPGPVLLRGSAGAAGKVEGTVRVLARPEEGELLQPGEILVTSSTNVGWTPLFPKAAAIVTDIGAPLSHAAIVARELGIPAVVGCGNATTRLKTGDRVRVNGGQGMVEILEEPLQPSDLPYV